MPLTLDTPTLELITTSGSQQAVQVPQPGNLGSPLAAALKPRRHIL